MTSPRRLGDLEVDQDLAYQTRTWRRQRVGWIVLALVIAAPGQGDDRVRVSVGREPIEVTCEVQPRAAGLLRARVGPAGQTPLELRQLVFP